MNKYELVVGTIERIVVQSKLWLNSDLHKKALMVPINYREVRTDKVIRQVLIVFFRLMEVLKYGDQLPKTFYVKIVFFIYSMGSFGLAGV